MKKSCPVNLSRGQAGSWPGAASEGELFVLVIDREKMIKQLLEAANNLGLSLEEHD